MSVEVSYAGVTFRHATEAFLDHLDASLSLKQVVEFDFPQRSPSTSLAGRMPPVSLYEHRLNQFYYPTGMSKWACWHGVVTASDAVVMQERAFPGGVWTKNKFTLKSTGGAITTGYETDLLMLPLRPVAPIANGLYLVTLVDERFIFNRDYSGIRLAKDQMPTWTALFGALAGSLGITLTIQYAIPAGYNVPDPDSYFHSNFENPCDLLDLAAWNVGGRIVREYGGEYSLYSYKQLNDKTKEEIAARQKDGLVLAGGVIADRPEVIGNTKSAASLIPSTIKVVFPTWDSVNGEYYKGTVNYLGPRSNAYKNTTEYTKDVSTLPAPYATLPTNGKTHVLYDTGKAMFDGSTITNAADLQSLVDQYAQDVVESFLQPADVSFKGVVPLPALVTGDQIVRMHRESVSTRITRDPYTPFMRQGAHVPGGVYVEHPDSLTGLTVEETDGDPSVKNVDTLRFDHEYFKVVEPAATEADVYWEGPKIRHTTNPYYQWPKIQFNPGSGVTISVTNDAANEEVDITISASATGAGAFNVWTAYEDCDNPAGLQNVAFLGAASDIVFAESEYIDIRQSFDAGTTTATLHFCWNGVEIYQGGTYQCAGGGLVSTAIVGFFPKIAFMDSDTVETTLVPNAAAGIVDIYHCTKPSGVLSQITFICPLAKNVAANPPEVYINTPAAAPDSQYLVLASGQPPAFTGKLGCPKTDWYSEVMLREIHGRNLVRAGVSLEITGQEQHAHAAHGFTHARECSELMDASRVFKDPPDAPQVGEWLIVADRETGDAAEVHRTAWQGLRIRSVPVPLAGNVEETDNYPSTNLNFNDKHFKLESTNSLSGADDDANLRPLHLSIDCTQKIKQHRPRCEGGVLYDDYRLVSVCDILEGRADDDTEIPWQPGPAIGCCDCPGVSVVCCDNAIPTNLTATFGGSLAALGSVPLTWNEAGSAWIGDGGNVCGITTIRFECDAGTNVFVISLGPSASCSGAAATSCLPFQWDCTGNSSGGGCDGAFTLTVTE